MRAAAAPPEARDDVRLLVARPGSLSDTGFRALPSYLRAGDLVVVNDSATLAAALDGRRADGTPVAVHFSTELDDGDWVVEVRPEGRATGPVTDVQAGERIDLPSGAWLRVESSQSVRLHRAHVAVEGPVTALLARRGRPISYAYVPGRYPLDAYQTVFARRPGSAEMPSAGRPFTEALVTKLVTRGVAVAPVTLHCGVSSAEAGEPPAAERFEVPAATAALVQHTRRTGGRVIAVGTTVTRALETTAGEQGSGWTDLVLSPAQPTAIVTGLVTGWHPPGASHLALLEAVAGPELVARAYAEAERLGYLCHEFGDSCLLLPD